MALADAEGLAKRGHQVVFFSACGTPPRDRHGIEWISLGQKNILDEPRRWLAATRGLWNWTAARSLKRLLIRFSPADTVIHLHSWSKALTGSVVWAADSAGFKVVSTQHDYFIVCPNGSFYDYPTRRACTLRPMSRSCVARNCDSRSYPHKFWRVLRQWGWQHLAGIPDRLRCIVAVSDFSYKKIRALIALVPIKVIENVIRSDPMPFSTTRAGLAYAGRIATEKGVDLYLEACARAGVEGEVWGDGPLLPALKKRWPDVIYSGWLMHEAMQERLSKLLILVAPSYLYETYGLIVAEAAAAGVATIVASDNAAADLVQDGVTGLLFRSGDVDDLAAKIDMLVRHPERAKEMGRLAYERFWSNYTVRKNDRWVALETMYQQVLACSLGGKSKL